MFYLYSYLNQFFNLFINVLPPPLRHIILKISLKKMGNSVMIDYGCYIRFPKKIVVGDRVSINRGCQFFPSHHFRDAYIVIDSDAVIAPGVTFIGAGQNPRDNDLSDIGASIHICSGAYIGANSTIRYGVTVGRNAVVAAGATVVKDVPPFTIVGGTPATLIRLRLTD